MEYLYERIPKNYEDFASGRVLYNAHGTTAFPVRLASEIIQRCFAMLDARGIKGPYTLYDPCCGGAYLLTVVGMLHHDKIRSLIASDINGDVLGIAEKNLSLLTADGLTNRKEQIKEYIRLYNKESHRSALESAERISDLMKGSNIEKATAFQRDVTGASDNSDISGPVHIVITDLPYGDIVTWTSDSPDPVAGFFAAMYELLNDSHAVLAVIADKSQKLKHDKFKRIEFIKAGKRQIAIFEPVHLST